MPNTEDPCLLQTEYAGLQLLLLVLWRSMSRELVYEHTFVKKASIPNTPVVLMVFSGVAMVSNVEV